VTTQATSRHDKIERNLALLIVLVVLVVSVGGLVEIVPLFFQKSTTEPIAGLKPYTALELAGRDIYIREGCNNCHSQMIRPFRAETERYGHYSVAGEFVYEHPFLWGSKRTGPDLARVGLRYSDEWHRVHLNNPRDVVPESNMPAYPPTCARCAGSACPTATRTSKVLRPQCRTKARWMRSSTTCRAWAPC
jgi:cytochrome c oxidase cbb3-type subunit 2